MAMMVVTACGNNNAETDSSGVVETSADSENSAAEPESTDKVWRIGVSTQAWKHEFIKNMVNSLNALDESMPNVELSVIDSEDSVEKQLNDVDTLIAQKMDGVILNADSMEGSSPAVAAANNAGIPIVELVALTENTDYDSFVGTDVKASGVMAGEIAAELLGGKGKIFELQGVMGHSAQVNRGAGIAEALENYPDIELVESQSGEFTKDKAMEVTEAWLTKYPEGEIDAIIAHNDGMALGAMNACISANRPEIKIIGIDGDLEALQAVIDGKMAATIVDYVEDEAKLAVEEMVSILNGNEPQKTILSEYIPVTTADEAKEFVDLRS
jgi:ABC-type sugar transport system substrate-binding protein